MVRKCGIRAALVLTLLSAAFGGEEQLRCADNELPGDLYTLEKLESIIPENDVGVRTFLERTREAREQLSETRFRYGPDFTSYYSRYPLGGSLPEEEENVLHFLSVGIRQDLIELLKIRPGRIEAMESRLDGAEAVLDEARNAAILELRKIYIGICEVSAIASFQASRVEIFSRMFDIEGARYAHLTTLLPELLYAQKELVMAEDELKYQEAELTRRKIFLADLMEIRPEQLVIEPLPIPVVLPEEEHVIELAMKNRGDIRLLEANARMEQANASVAAYDDIRLSAFVGYRIRDTRLSGPETGIGFNVTFTMPFLIWNLQDSRTNRFLAREKSYLFEAEKERRDITREIHIAFADYRRLRNRYDTAMRGIGLTAEKLRIEKARLENPVGSFESDPVSVLKIESELATKEMEREMIRSRMLETYYELFFLAGLSEMGKIGSEPDSEPPSYVYDPPFPGNNEVRTIPVAMEQDLLSGNDNWVIQVASYSDFDQAIELVESLRNMEYDSFLTLHTINDTSYYRVIVGIFATHEEAFNAGQSIKIKYDIPQVLIMKVSSGIYNTY